MPFGGGGGEIEYYEFIRHNALDGHDEVIRGRGASVRQERLSRMTSLAVVMEVTQDNLPALNRPKVDSGHTNTRTQSESKEQKETVKIINYRC